MKKVLCAVILMLSICVSALAETPPVSVSNEVVQAMLESALENGFSPQKDLQAMLNNALQNGYDYSSVSYYETTNFIKVEIAIDGFASAVKSLVNSKSKDTVNEIAKAKEMVISHYDAIHSLLIMVGRDDVQCLFKLLDDEMLFKYDIHESTIVTIVDQVGKDLRVSFHGAWSETEQNQEEGN